MGKKKSSKKQHQRMKQERFVRYELSSVFTFRSFRQMLTLPMWMNKLHHFGGKRRVFFLHFRRNFSLNFFTFPYTQNAEHLKRFFSLLCILSQFSSCANFRHGFNVTRYGMVRILFGPKSDYPMILTMVGTHTIFEVYSTHFTANGQSTE